MAYPLKDRDKIAFKAGSRVDHVVYPSEPYKVTMSEHGSREKGTKAGERSYNKAARRQVRRVRAPLR